MFCLLSLLLWIIYLLVQLQKWILFCKNIYILLGKARITVILAFSLGALLTISEICREVDALSCVPGFNCQWFFPFLPSEALALPYIFKHSMAAFLVSSGPLCFFMHIFYTLQAGWKFIQEQREHGRSCSVCKPHFWGFCQCWNLHLSSGEFSRSSYVS